MTVNAKCIIESVQAANAETAQYSAAAGVRTILDKFTGTNVTAGAVSLAVKLVPSGGAAGASNLIVTRTLQPGETYTFPEIVGHVLNPGDFISTLAGAAASITLRASGREVT